ncbi:MAG: hypothetical protein COW24_04225 [Candidatus Kerfeldbacteria bacterium CG15_BIG_FIL_POST_REV_8_21_14_020_45_12]|uniref:DUF721 domain-containing protein n=1 Tax=Candidatus Kerfeldbacteria bacterium CG15_BIG_FIL_POST_REV_8_21_14_020_45_12 TaxID=2014247 RepID=A0A2M7H330_9BACT|nr:MAG: hypothetical protein COW24_04225 [Candidatus Kerfeldbacteria bacterium CG15_BIG_FIL_POST_REV_8_21_14_020_45_12]PJA93318.1 MAG: hypothetical protein CO132_03760 [Candidatus Kerfeldbacteria bacterium CG_4_9_14_3_um_filter_45_8]
MAGGAFQKVGNNLFHDRLSKIGIGKQVQAAQYVELAVTVLKSSFGEGALKHARPRAIKNRVLQIEIAHPAVGEEIRRLEETIISELNNKIGRPEIVRIQLVLPQVGQNLREDG